MSVAGRVALVTGGGRGIGRGIALALAGEGAAVGVCDIDGGAAGSVTAEIEAIGGRARGIQMDVTDGKTVRAAVEWAESQLGAIDILVNNAGWDQFEPFVESSEDTWDRIIAINLKGPLICTRAVLDGMIARGGGRIINIGSDAGRVGSSGEAVYSATKGGVIAFTKTLARELARSTITVNCVCPGPTETALLASMADSNPNLLEALKRAIPMRRLGQPDDVAAAVVFLAGDGAGYITGQTLSVSGGLTMA